MGSVTQEKGERTQGGGRCLSTRMRDLPRIRPPEPWEALSLQSLLMAAGAKTMTSGWSSRSQHRSPMSHTCASSPFLPDRPHFPGCTKFSLAAFPQAAPSARMLSLHLSPSSFWAQFTPQAPEDGLLTPVSAHHPPPHPRVLRGLPFVSARWVSGILTPEP